MAERLVAAAITPLWAFCAASWAVVSAVVVPAYAALDRIGLSGR